jgi:hypothetical protein
VLVTFVSLNGDVTARIILKRYELTNDGGRRLEKEFREETGKFY